MSDAPLDIQKIMPFQDDGLQMPAFAEILPLFEQWYQEKNRTAGEIQSWFWGHTCNAIMFCGHEDRGEEAVLSIWIDLNFSNGQGVPPEMHRAFGEGFRSNPMHYEVGFMITLDGGKE